MRIISWNTNGVRATAKQGFFTPLFETYSPDIVCLQETKAEEIQLPEEVRTPKGYFSYFASSKVKKGYSGVAIYTKTQPTKVEGLGIPEFDDEGRTLIAYFEDTHEAAKGAAKRSFAAPKLALINCYFPNGGGGPIRLDYKLRFYDAFLEKIDSLRKQGYAIIFCGDINTAHTEIDLARPKENVDNTGFLPIEREWLDQVATHGYVDVFRHLYPNKKDVYTYWDMKTGARNRNVGWRIDYFFVSPDLVKHIQQIDTLAEYYGSDHCPLMFDIK